MNDPQSTPNEHAQFNALTAHVEEYEPLPEHVPGPANTTPGLSAQGHDDSFDEEILAGLVSP